MPSSDTLARADAAAVAGHATIPRLMTLLLATACGAIAANLYYAQPLIALIGPDVGLGQGVASLVVTLAQIGYGLGLVLLVPVGDLVESRRLIAATLVANALALVGAALAPSAWPYLVAAALIGFSSVTAQILVPVAAHLAPDETRGRVVGNVMSGLLAGILLARPVSSMVAHLLGWRAVFGGSALLMALLAVALAFLLPQYRPTRGASYASLMRSMVSLLRHTPVLRRRAFYQAGLFASFSLFWTAVPLLLASPVFDLTQRGIALFGLAGAGGVVVAPLAGRLADRGWTRTASVGSMVAVGVSFLIARLGGGGSMAALVAAVLLLDLGVTCNLIIGQRAIYALASDARSRLNGLYMAIIFTGGALGSAVVSPAYAAGGWRLVTGFGMGFAGLSLLGLTGELVLRRGKRPA